MTSQRVLWHLTSMTFMFLCTFAGGVPGDCIHIPGRLRFPRLYGAGDLHPLAQGGLPCGNFTRVPYPHAGGGAGPSLV